MFSLLKSQCECLREFFFFWLPFDLYHFGRSERTHQAHCGDTLDSSSLTTSAARKRPI